MSRVKRNAYVRITASKLLYKTPQITFPPRFLKRRLFIINCFLIEHIVTKKGTVF